MPNLSTPVTNLKLAKEYYNDIKSAMEHLPRQFTPLMTLYLTDKTSSQQIIEAAKSEIVLGIKLYPSGATTNSQSGVVDISALFPIFEIMQREKLNLMIHGEVTDSEIDPFDKEKFFIEQSKKFNNYFFDSNKKEIFVRSLPRILLELSLILGLSFFLILVISKNKNFQDLLPSIVLFAAAGYRMLPSINRILTSLQKLRFASPVIENINNQLKNKINYEINNEKVPYKNFNKEIKFENVSFTYPGSSKKIFKNLNFSLKKNERIGIQGESGSGKSTFVNLISGLIKCTNGDISIDKNNLKEINIKDFQKRIGYVPQQTFLLDDSIRNNIAFGLNTYQYEDKKIHKILDIVELSNFINNLENGLETIVGERGTKLSGGQIQRIGIARALFIDPELLILDEATNALDLKTEKNVLKNINYNYKNISKIVVAHRQSSFHECEKIYQINEGKFVNKNE